MSTNPHDRIEEIRTELRAERISYGELAELSGLVEYISPDDLEMLEAAGVPETAEEIPAELAEYVEDFVSAYIVCALWASNDNDRDPEGLGEPMDANYGPEDLTDEATAAMRADCVSFIAANFGDLMVTADYPQAWPDGDWTPGGANGHDLWLTRNHHGAGFWDRGYPKDAADRLTAAAHAMGEAGIWGDGEKVHAGF